MHTRVIWKEILMTGYRVMLQNNNVNRPEEIDGIQGT